MNTSDGIRDLLGRIRAWCPYVSRRMESCLESREEAEGSLYERGLGRGRLADLGERSPLRLVFLGVALFGLSMVLYPVLGYLYAPLGISAIPILSMYVVMGGCLLVLGVDRYLSGDWRYVGSRFLVAVFLVIGVLGLVFILFMAWSRFMILPQVLRFSEQFLPLAVMDHLVFLGYLEVGVKSFSSVFVHYFGPLVVWCPVLILFFAWRAGSDRFVDLVDSVGRCRGAIGVYLSFFGLSMLVLGTSRAFHGWSQLMIPVAGGILLTGTGISIGTRKRVRFRVTRILLVCLSSVLALFMAVCIVELFIGAYGTSLFRVSALLQYTGFAVAVTGVFLALVMPGSRVFGNHYRSITVLLVGIISVASIAMGMGHFQLPVIDEVSVETMEIGRAGRDTRTRITVEFTVKNRDNQPHMLGVTCSGREGLGGAEVIPLGEIAPGESKTGVASFQVVLPGTYEIGIYLYIGGKSSRDYLDGERIDAKTVKVTIGDG